MKFDRSPLLRLAVLLAISPSLSLGYGGNAHRSISREAVANTNTLSANVPFSDWAPLTDAANAMGPILSLQFENSKGDVLLVRELVAGGAVDEDAPAVRVLNHFFDPVNKSQLTDLLPVPIPLPLPFVYTSPDWAINGSGQSFFPRSFSYADARQQMLLGLTSKSNDVRNANIGFMFETLGHVIHHLQDMAQPQHVRNEEHLNISGSNDPYSRTNFPSFSRYEAWAEVTPINLDGYQIKQLLSGPMDYWTVQGPNNSVPLGGGIADFANRNFVTPNRMFLQVNGSPVSDTMYHMPIPLASGQPTEISSLLQDPPFNCRPGLASSNALCSLDGIVTFVSTSVTDNLKPELNDTNPRAAMWSIYDQDLTVNNGPFGNPTSGHYTVNVLTFPSAAQELIPRAVGYSAGLLDYFFRGKIDLLPHILSDGSTDGTYDFKNLSAEPIIVGTVELYYDATDGNRYQAVGTDNNPWSVRVQNVGPGQFQTQLPLIGNLSPEPAQAGVYMMVFKGTMGSEGPIGSGPGAVVAKQVNLPLPEIFWSNNSYFVQTIQSGPYPPGTYTNAALSLRMPQVPSQPGVYYYDSFLYGSYGSAAHVLINGQEVMASTDVIPGTSSNFEVDTCTDLFNDAGGPQPPHAFGLHGLDAGRLISWNWEYSKEDWTRANDQDKTLARILRNWPNWNAWTEFQTMLQNAVGHNILQSCGTILAIGFPSPPQAMTVEYLVGSQSIFKFCLQVDPFTAGTNSYRAYISHMRGIRLTAGAIDIALDPMMTCPGY